MGELSPLMKYACQVLDDAKQRIVKGECSEATIQHFIEQTNAESKGYFREDDFCNYDQAMREIHVGSREGLQKILAKFRVKNKSVNNVKVGFLKSEIQAVAGILKRPPVKQRRKKNE